MKTINILISLATFLLTQIVGRVAEKKVLVPSRLRFPKQAKLSPCPLTLSDSILVFLFPVLGSNCAEFQLL